MFTASLWPWQQQAGNSPLYLPLNFGAHATNSAIIVFVQRDLQSSSVGIMLSVNIDQYVIMIVLVKLGKSPADIKFVPFVEISV